MIYRKLYLFLLTFLFSQVSLAAYVISGTGELVDDAGPGGFLAATQTYSGTGTRTGNILDYSMTIENNTIFGLVTIYAVGTIDINTATGTDQVINCLGNSIVCDTLNYEEEAFNTASFDASNPNDISWTLSETVTNVIGSGVLTASINAVQEVPLPAGAWLFLSAIGGLGILKRR